MTQPEPGKIPMRPAENARDSASSPTEARPDSPVSQQAASLGAQPLESGLISIPGRNAIRPPAPELAKLTPKVPSAPAPRMRPAAPPASSMPGNIGRSGGENVDPNSGADGGTSATQEIADVYSHDDAGAARGPVQIVPGESLPAASVATIRARPATSRDDPLFLRRTVIPIFLTGGIVLAGFGACLRCGGDENALADLFPSWTPTAFFVLGSVFLIVGALNVLSVRNELRR